MVAAPVEWVCVGDDVVAPAGPPDAVVPPRDDPVVTGVPPGVEPDVAPPVEVPPVVEPVVTTAAELAALAREPTSKPDAIPEPRKIIWVK